MTDDKLIDHPPIIMYRGDIDRLRSYGLAHRLGDSATALRHLLDRPVLMLTDEQRKARLEEAIAKELASSGEVAGEGFILRLAAIATDAVLKVEP